METYVIRIATKREGDATALEGELRGTVEHVGTSHRDPFRDVSALLAFLRSEHQHESEEVER